MLTGLVGHNILPKGTSGSRALRIANLNARKHRRRILKGFPIEPRTFTYEEVKEYLSGDKICCLRCGRYFDRLFKHLASIHNISIDEYKTMYGLPWSVGLMGSNLRERYKKFGRAEIKPEYQRLGTEAILKKAARRQPFMLEIILENQVKAVKSKKTRQFQKG